MIDQTLKETPCSRLRFEGSSTGCRIQRENTSVLPPSWVAFIVAAAGDFFAGLALVFAEAPAARGVPLVARTTGAAGTSAPPSLPPGGHGGFVPGHVGNPLTITTNNTRHLSHPPSQHTRHPSMSSPSSTARKSRRNFVSTHMIRSPHAWLCRGEKSTPKSMGLIPESPGRSFSVSLVSTRRAQVRNPFAEPNRFPLRDLRASG